MKIILFSFVLTCGLGAVEASGQTLDAAARSVKPGVAVSVTDVDGAAVTGRLVSISPASVELLTPAAVVIPADRVKQIDKIGDPVGDGFRKGALVGGAYGAFVGAVVLGNKEDMAAFLPMVGTGAIEMGLIGLLIDALHQGRTTLYRAPGKGPSMGLVPLSSRGTRGLAVALKF